MTSVAEASNVVRTLGKSISFAPAKPLFAQRLCEFSRGRKYKQRGGAAANVGKTKILREKEPRLKSEIVYGSVLKRIKCALSAFVTLIIEIFGYRAVGLFHGELFDYTRYSLLPS